MGITQTLAEYGSRSHILLKLCRRIFLQEYLPSVAGKVDRITTHLAVNADLFLAEMTWTWHGVSCEVQHVDISVSARKNWRWTT